METTVGSTQVGQAPDDWCGDFPAPCNCDDPRTHDGASVPAVARPLTEADYIYALFEARDGLASVQSKLADLMTQTQALASQARWESLRHALTEMALESAEEQVATLTAANDALQAELAALKGA